LPTVEPLDETLPAFLYAQSQGFFSFPEVKNAVWDIGGGTAIARIYLPNGTLIHDAEVILPGTKALAQQVAVEMKEVFNLDFSPNLADIMDAIQKGDLSSTEPTASTSLASIKTLVRSGLKPHGRDSFQVDTAFTPVRRSSW
jgi:hypothetical protein